MVDIPSLRDAYRTHKLALFDQLRSARAPTRSVHTVLRQLAALADETLSALWRTPNSAASWRWSRSAASAAASCSPIPTSTCWCCCRRTTRAASSRRASRPSSASAGTPGWRSAPACAPSPNAWRRPAATSRCRPRCSSRACWSVTRSSTPPFARTSSRAIDPRAFFAAKSQEMRHRHHKFDNTPYALEPNCKESPGRPARPADRALDDQGRRLRQPLGRPRPQRPGDRLRGAADQAQRGAAEPDPRAPARHRQPARGPAGVRPADRGGRHLRLSSANRSARPARR